MVHNNTLTSAYICWARPGSGMVREYYLEYWRFGWDSRKANVTVPESGDSITCYNMTHLAPWKQYYAKVTGANQHDTSPTSGLLLFQTSINGKYTSGAELVVLDLWTPIFGYICRRWRREMSKNIDNGFRRLLPA